MSNNTIDKMAQQFSTMAELQAYSTAQYTTIISLTKKINELETEKNHLEKLLTNSTPLVKEEASEFQLMIVGSDEETICRIQLKKLKDKCLNAEELTLEETKRVEIYTKLLIAIKGGDVKAKEEMGQKLDEGTLLSLVSNIDELK